MYRKGYSRDRLQSPKWIIFIIFLAYQVHMNAATIDELLPELCASVKCPPISTMTCPDDSDIRETLTPIELLNTITSKPTEETYNTTEIDPDIYSECCLNKKCLCRTCYIQDCRNDNTVVVEIIPESMNMPGHCCGTYECRKEPNCTEVNDTDMYWLTDCQRCKCYSGERICHQSCDEGIKKPTAICNSKNLNEFFKDGETWRDGCYECECVHGEEKCTMSLCANLNCPKSRQVLLKGKCCPVCWPECSAIVPPIDYEDDNFDEPSINGKYYDDDDNDPISSLPAIDVNDKLPNIDFDTTSTKTTSIIINNYNNNKMIETISNISLMSSTTTMPPSSTPCARVEQDHNDGDNVGETDTYQVDVVTPQSQTHFFWATIIVLSCVIVVLVFWNVNLRAKQRSYRPVSNLDDNFNKMPSNITKTNDYV